MFGTETRSGQFIVMLVKKLTGFLRNSPCVDGTLEKRCLGTGGSCSIPGGRHEPCSSKIAFEAQRISDQLRANGVLKQGATASKIADGDIDIEVLKKYLRT